MCNVRFLLTMVAAMTAMRLVIVPVHAAPPDRPDILLIMADDVGVEGFGCYGGASYATPHIDAMASRGVRFTHAYAQPLCTNTRLQLMTGRYNHRHWQAFGIMPRGETTIGHLATKAGYRTGMFGKWQLQSYDPPDFPNADRRRDTGMHPSESGFDQYATFHSRHTEDKGSRYASPRMEIGTRGSRGEVKDFPGSYGEDLWAEMVVDFLTSPSDQPRLVYYPMALPHRPFEPPPTGKSFNGVPPDTDEVIHIGDMIEYLDTVVGRIIDRLEAAGRLENTIVVFYSDNGTHQRVQSRMKDGRAIPGGKGLSTQTGIHVPLVVLAPDRYLPSVNDRIVDSTDFFPTLADWMGVPVPHPDAVDGISFAHQLAPVDGEPSTGPDRDAAFFFYDPRPGWDKTAFDREIFAVNRTHKYFHDGRLFRINGSPAATPVVLSEHRIDKAVWTDQDRLAADQLRETVSGYLSGGPLPPLVDAFGEPLAVPTNSAP